VPGIGLGTFMTFDLVPGARREHIREIVRRFWEAGGRVIDTSPLYGSGEVSLGDAATSLGITDGLFVMNKLWTTGDYLADDSHAERSLQLSRERLWRERVDVMQCHSLVNVDIIVPLLRRWKNEGRVRYVGVTHHEPAYFDALASWIERDAVDTVQLRYSIFSREAERRVLPAAAERGVAVLVNMPLEKGRLHQVVAGRPLPAFARELGIESWAEYFLKWVAAHPAVTCVLPATSNPAHVAENVRALRGPLPDEAMRERMRQHVAAFPGFAQLDARGAASWYPGKQYPGLVARAQQALR
jgi:diketogulonate reductase-like aldo/keto reductase